jgi:hypothetical protein
MPQLTIYLSDNLLAWIDENAEFTKRSRTKQIEYLLEQVRRIPAFSHEQRYELESAGLCYNSRHRFKASEPAMGDFCNCGMYMFGEVKG